MKKLQVTLLALMGLWAQVNAQAIISKNLMTDFGAVGDGITNDKAAFYAATHWFNNEDANGNPLSTPNIDYNVNRGELIIPSGIFLIDGQVIDTNPSDNTYYAFLDDLLHLKNINGFGMQIVGTGTIQYSATLKYGCYDPLTGNQLSSCWVSSNPVPSDINYGAYVGNAVWLQNCNNILIQGIVIAGGVTATNISPNFNDAGIQGLGYNGFYVIDCKNITVQSVYVTNMGSDGILLSNPNPPVNNTNDNIQLLNSTFNYNSRCGLGWVGGNGLIATDCSFSYTGRNAYLNNPGCGIDIENERFNIAPTDPFEKITNGVFTRCKVLDNYRHGLISDATDPAVYPSNSYNFHNRDMVFDDCTFGTTGIGSVIWDNGINNTFNNCTINGAIVRLRNADNTYEATKFNNCYISDEYNNVEASTLFQYSPDLGYWGQRAVFDNCNFTYSKKLNLMFMQPDLQGDTTETIKMKNCKFNFNLPAQSGGGSMYGVKFIGNTTLKNLNTNPTGLFLATTYIDSRGINKDKFYVDGNIKIIHGDSYGTPNPLHIGLSSPNGVNLQCVNNATLDARLASRIHLGYKSTMRFGSDYNTNAFFTGGSDYQMQLDGDLIIEDNATYGYYQYTNPQIILGQYGQHYLSKNATCYSNGHLICIKGGNTEMAIPNTCVTKSALQFDGVNDFVKVDEFERANNTAPNNVFTIEANIRSLAPINANNYIVSRYSVVNNQPYNGYELFINANKIKFKYYANGTGVTYSSPAWIYNDCYHIAVTYDAANNSLKFHCNGGTNGFVNVLNVALSPQQSTSPLYIGKSGNPHFNGYIGRLGIWKKALLASEINQIRANTYVMDATTKPNVYALYLFDDFAGDYSLTDHTIYYNEFANVKYAKRKGILGSTNNPDVNDPVYVDYNNVMCTTSFSNFKTSENNSESTSTELANLITDERKVFPNPFINAINIQLTSSAQITVKDAIGRVVFEGQLNAGVNEVKTETWAAGLYTLQMTQDGKSAYFKLTK